LKKSKSDLQAHGQSVAIDRLSIAHHWTVFQCINVMTSIASLASHHCKSLDMLQLFPICYHKSVRLSVCLLVHPTQPVKIFDNFSTPFGNLAIHWHRRKILRRWS